MKNNYYTKLNYTFYKLCARFTLFLTMFLVVLVTLFISGTFQSFKDSSLNFILVIASFCCIVLFLLSILGMIESIITFIQTKKRNRIVYFFIFLIDAIICPVLLVLFKTINFISELQIQL